MRILHNPSTSEVPEYNLNGVLVNVGGLGPNKVKQFKDAIGADLLERFGFLEEVTPQRAEDLVKKAQIPAEEVQPTPEEVQPEPAVDPSLVPVDTPKKVVDSAGSPQAEKEETTEDKLNLPTGPGWYGEGYKETKTMRKVNQVGKGHFKANISEE